MEKKQGTIYLFSNWKKRLKILRNIGMAFVKMTQYKDAVENFEQIVESNNYDVQTGNSKIYNNH